MTGVFDAEMLPFIEGWRTDPLSGEERPWSIRYDFNGERPAVQRLAGVMNAWMSLTVEGAVEPPDVLDMSVLEPVIGLPGQINIAGYQSVIAGADTLERAVNLRRLIVQGGEAQHQPDLSELPELRSFSGLVGRGFDSVFANPGLEEVFLDGASATRPRRIEAPIRRFGAWMSPRLRRLPVLAHPEALEEFELRVGSQFDVASLLPCRNLRRVKFDGSRRLRNIAALLDLPLLEDVWLDECTSEEDWEVLEPLSAAKVLLTPKPAPSVEFRRRVQARGWWVDAVPPEHAGSGEAFVFDEQGVDRWSFAPLEVFAPFFDDDRFSLVLDDLGVLRDAAGNRNVGGGLATRVMAGVVAAEAPGAVVQPDPEGDSATLLVDGAGPALDAARAVHGLLNDPDRLAEAIRHARGG